MRSIRGSSPRKRCASRLPRNGPRSDTLTGCKPLHTRSARCVADWTINKTGGKGKIIELEGSVGASPANDRKKGFDETVKAKPPGMVILASQSGDFARDKGRQVAETLLQAHPDATIVYAHNRRNGAMRHRRSDLKRRRRKAP